MDNPLDLAVQSRHVVDRIDGEPFRFDCPLFADELVGREALEGLQSAPEVVGADDVGQMPCELIMVIVVEAFDGGLLDRAVHPLDLAAPRENSPPDCFLVLAAPGVVGLRQPVVDLMLAADAVEDVLEGIDLPVVVGELDAPRHCLSDQWRSNGSIGENDVEPVGHGRDQMA